MLSTFEDLPVEIQRMILRNLLHGNNIHIITGKYQFHVNILKCSRKMYKVAHELLYGENDFILFRGVFPDLLFQLRLLHVPIVSSHASLETFEHHILTISYRGEGPHVDRFHTNCHQMGPCPAVNCEFPRDWASTHYPLRILILARDMKVLTRALRILGHYSYCIQPGAEDLAFPTKPLPAIAILRDRARYKYTNLHARMNMYGRPELWSSKAEAILLPFADVLSSRVVKATSLPVLSGLGGGIESSARPKVMHLDAIGWDLVDLMRSWKDDLDQLVRETEDSNGKCYCMAIAGYCLLVDILVSVDFTLVVRSGVAASGVLDWSGVLAFVALDTANILFRLCFHLGKSSEDVLWTFEVARLWVAQIRSRSRHLDISPSLGIEHVHQDALAASVCYGACAAAYRRIGRTIAAIRSLDLPEEMLADLEFDFWTLEEHLFATGPRQVEDMEALSSKHHCEHPFLDRRTCSQADRRLSSFILNTKLDVQRPSGLEGWINTNESFA